MEAADRGSRRAADRGSDTERGSDATKAERGSCRGSEGGGAGSLSFEPLFFFFLSCLRETASTDCIDKPRMRIERDLPPKFFRLKAMALFE